ncbi:autotransporter domain-containing protein [Sphingomonas sp.]|uniref:autotransporter domain-containing protein n=1 Tax=Sphingomonas sp. TaxID=28214 RepID=UPI0025ED83D4|nr:autotransporter domain-containing protein [Sphingomonas sp.]
MIYRRLLAATLLGATALGLAAPASAQRVSRIVAFGDSYADDGNFFQLVGLNPLTTVIYPTGRLSGGTNYIDTLGQLLNVPIDNFAIGGALTSDYNTVTGPGLGFPTEFGSFLAGGGPAAFPRVSGRFGPTDLLAVSIGGNDARLYQRGSVANGTPGPVIAPGTLLGAPAAGAAAAAAAKTGLDALVAAGARNISFLAGNTASLPEVAGDPSAFAIRTSYSTTFNSAMQPTLAGYAANGAIVNYLDLSLALSRVSANPTAYGLTSAGVCAPIASCLNSAYSSQYLFYVDGLHLTSAGFAIVARYVATQMEAPLTLQATSDLALDIARQFGRTLTTRMDLGSPRDGELLSGVRLFAVGDSFTRKVAASMTNDQFKVTSVGGTLGLEAGFSNGTAGIAANYSRPKARFANDAASTRSQSYQLGAFAGFGIAGGFAQGYLGYGHDKHRIERAGVIDAMSAKPSGTHWLAGAKAGYLMPMGGFRVGPVVALDYAKAKVNAYTETGDAALTLNVREQRFSSLRGDAGIELRGDFGTGDSHFRPFASLVAEKDFTGDGRTAYYALTAAPTIINHFAFADASKKTYARASAGLASSITGGVSIDAAVSGTFGKKQGNETSGQVGLNFGF